MGVNILHDWWCLYVVLSQDGDPRAQELARQAYVRIQEVRVPAKVDSLPLPSLGPSFPESSPTSPNPA